MARYDEHDRDQVEDQQRGKECREWLAELHAIILRLHGRGRNPTKQLCSCDDVWDVVRNRHPGPANKAYKSAGKP
jgi:hypothetical protein